ncbi:MAG TPA: hypothetical protein EYG90_04165, partial [Campylobacterales bacterium]|nr:hypothetical protein [Campylobacterales bacterium]
MSDNNYDKEEYERERQERIAYIESIERQSEEEFNESKESSEYEYKEEGGKSKQVLLGLLMTGTIGIIGYTGFNYLQDDTSQPQKTIVMGPELTKVEEVAPASQEKETAPLVQIQAPIEEKPELIASVAPLPIVAPKVTTEKSTVEPTPSSIPKREIKTDNTLNELSEIVSGVIESSKSKIEKIEENVPEKEPEAKKVIVVKETVKIEQPKRVKPRVVIVRKGDTLASIA